MGMRLLPKKEIKSAADEIRKREIEEGHKLAKQIAGIRQTKAEEEISLEKFRSETLKNIKAELEPLQRELEDTKKELEEARKIRTELLTPLDAEWEKVKKAKAEVERELEEALRASTMAQDERNQVKVELVKAERTNARLLTLEEVAQEARNGAILLEREAKELREIADNTMRNANARESEALANIAEEHRKLTMRAEALEINEAQVRKDQEEIARVKLQLEDERETLKRALKRKS
jgi:exonuclease SbcC